MLRYRHILGGTFSACAALQPCAAQGVFIGAWDVVAQDPAPWVTARQDRKAQAEPALRNAHIVFSADRVVAPLRMGCKKPKFEMMQLAFDSLFEGGLSDPGHGLNDPKKLALKIGFTQEPVLSMVTSCSELLFHLVDPNTAVFALNNMVYTLRRHQSSP